MDNNGLSRLRVVTSIIFILIIVINVASLIVGQWGRLFAALTLVAIISLMAFRRQYLIQNKQNSKITDFIMKLSPMIMAMNSREELYQGILEATINRVDAADKGSIIITDEEDEMTFAAVVGFDLEEVSKINLKLEDTVLYRVSEGKIEHSVIIKDITKFNEGEISEEEYEKMKEAGIDQVRSTISSPLIIDGHLFGMINVDACSNKRFSEFDRMLLESISDEISKAIVLYQLFEKTIYKSTHDNLTRNHNRWSFFEVAGEALKLKDKTIAFAFCDLDGLKGVNDKYGHDVGDMYIRRFSEVMSKGIGKRDIVGRLGGDEFVLMMHGDEDKVMAHVEQCRDILKYQPMNVEDHLIPVVFSSGIASCPKDGRGLDELIYLADQRMYEEKRRRKTREAQSESNPD